MLIIGRYADVTAPALYGREINLYWDLRHVSAVAAMLARVASLWQLLLALATAILVPVVLFAVIGWALQRVSEAMGYPRERRAIELLAVVIVALFVGQRMERFPAVPGFSAPVTQTYWRQARLLWTELAGGTIRRIGPDPRLDSDLARVQGADVLLIFIESYGAVSYDRREVAEPLTGSRARFEADVRATGREVVSAYVESPTFGGNSWLAHVSLISGVEVRDEDTNVLVMARKRNTFLTPFVRQGYRAIAVMPGLQSSWPEGAFYGFDTIYGEAQLDYRGPPFGWWNVPDQFTIARMDQLELARRPRAPVFVFFPTIGTHTPFSPTPPYQPDWARVLTENPYDRKDLETAWAEVPDWLDLGPNYVRALSYAYTSIGGYLRMRADRDFVLILIGDHQPPAAVTGEHADWDVPVHVVTNRPGVLDSLVSHGFRTGMTPSRPSVARMHALTPILLAAFGSAPARPPD